MHGVNIGMVERVNHICYDIHKIRIEFSTVTKTGKGLHLSLAILMKLCFVFTNFGLEQLVTQEDTDHQIDHPDYPFKRFIVNGMRV